MCLALEEVCRVPPSTPLLTQRPSAESSQARTTLLVQEENTLERTNAAAKNEFQQFMTVTARVCRVNASRSVPSTLAASKHNTIMMIKPQRSHSASMHS